MIYATRVRDLECRKREGAGDRLSARHDCGAPPADTLLASCESPARIRFRRTSSDPVGAVPVVRLMSAALNGSGLSQTASRSAAEHHRCAVWALGGPGLRRAVRPSAVRNITLFPSA